MWRILISLLKVKNNYEFPINLIQTYLGQPTKRELVLQFSENKVICDFIKGRIDIFSKGNLDKVSYEDFQRNDAFLEQLELFFKNLDNEYIHTPVTLSEAYKSIDLANKILVKIES